MSGYIEAYDITLERPLRVPGSSFDYRIRVECSISKPFKCHNCDRDIEPGKGYCILNLDRDKAFHLCNNCGNKIIEKLRVIENL